MLCKHLRCHIRYLVLFFLVVEQNELLWQSSSYKPMGKT